MIAGIATATEAQRAVNAGASVVKFFPAATSGGLPAVRALSAVFTRLSFVPTGGITPDELGTWLAAPAVVAVGGSWIAPRDLLRAGRFDQIEHLARQTTEVLTGLSEGSRHRPAAQQPGEPR